MQSKINGLRYASLYKNTSKNGKTYLSGRFEHGSGARLLVLPNPEKKDGDNLPDFIVYLTPEKPKPKE